jgi:xanthine dehydrogenase YagT iron-sulfur-binding subunit
MIETFLAQAQRNVSMDLRITVNGLSRTLKVEPRTTLLDTLREELALTGPKNSADRGECGGCAVHIEGRRVLSCMTLAAMQGRHRPAQEMFIEHDGFQCGSCTSGQIMPAVAMIEKAKAGWLRQASAGSADHHREAIVRCWS